MQNDIDAIRGKVRAYILENLLFTNDASQLDDDASLLERGIIVSTGVLEIVMFLEEQFGIKVKDSDMLPENFDKVDSIARFVSRSVAAA
jgi:acyl carrier protein